MTQAARQVGVAAGLAAGARGRLCAAAHVSKRRAPRADAQRVRVLVPRENLSLDDRLRKHGHVDIDDQLSLRLLHVGGEELILPLGRELRAEGLASHGEVGV